MSVFEMHTKQLLKTLSSSALDIDTVNTSSSFSPFHFLSFLTCPLVSSNQKFSLLFTFPDIIACPPSCSSSAISLSQHQEGSSASLYSQVSVLFAFLKALMLEACVYLLFKVCYLNSLHVYLFNVFNTFCKALCV